MVVLAMLRPRGTIGEGLIFTCVVVLQAVAVAVATTFHSALVFVVAVVFALVYRLLQDCTAKGLIQDHALGFSFFSDLEFVHDKPESPRWLR